MVTATRLGQLLAPGLSGLKKFTTEHTDRSPPQSFAGRKNVISDVEDACSSSWESFSTGIPQSGSSTRLIFGAPGAGKTSTLVHVHDEWAEGSCITNRSDGTERIGPAPLMLFSESGSILDSFAGFCTELVELVEPGKGDDLVADFRELIRVSVGIDALFSRGRTENEKATQLNVIRAGLDAVTAVVPRNKWKRPVVIGVDETQNLYGDKYSPVGRLLQEIHLNNHKLPLTVVLAGLSDSIIARSLANIPRRFIECWSLAKCSHTEVLNLTISKSRIFLSIH